MVNFYIEALKVWNAGGEAWCIPRKGTEKQKEVKAIMEKAKNPKRRKLRKEPEEKEKTDKTKTDKKTDNDMEDKPIEKAIKRKLRKAPEEKPKEEEKPKAKEQKANKEKIERDKYAIKGDRFGEGDLQMFQLNNYNPTKLTLVYERTTNPDYTGPPKEQLVIDNVKFNSQAKMFQNEMMYFFDEPNIRMFRPLNKESGNYKFFEKGLRYLKK